MSAEANLATLQGAYARWHETKGGSADELLDMFDDEVEMLSALSADVPHEVSGVHMHRAEAAQYFEGLARDWEMIFYHVDRFIVGEEDANGDNEIVMVGRCSWKNRNTGITLDVPKIDVHSFKGGKVVRFQESYDTLAFARALGMVP